MATPIGHALLGSGLGRLAGDGKGRILAAGAVSACAPDLDVIPGLLMSGQLSLYHHQASHSLAAALLFALIGTAALQGRLGVGRRLTFMVLLAGYVSHLALDFVTLDTSAPHGIPIFWPWMEAHLQSPWLLLPNVQHSRDPLFGLHNLLLALREILILTPLHGLLRELRRCSAGEAAKLGVWMVWFAAAAAWSVWSMVSR